jgi:8-oxo-dGTP diphosphatase
MQYKVCDCPDLTDETIHKIATVILKDKKILVVKKKDIDEYISLGGKHYQNEHHHETLARESQEELGINISNPQYIGRFHDIAIKEKTPIVVDLYVSESSDEPKPNHEIEEYLWISKDYQKDNVKLASILEKFIIPELSQRGLM